MSQNDNSIRRFRLPDGTVVNLKSDGILYDTVAGWASKPKLISEPNIMYVYTDYQVVDGENVPGIKFGDGNAYLIDRPFIDILYARHIADNVIHITQKEREFWNNKVTAFIAPEQADLLVLSKAPEEEYHG